MQALRKTCSGNLQKVELKKDQEYRRSKVQTRQAV